jgi:hypothetical protein
VSKYSQCQINDAHQQIRVQITKAQRENSHDPATTPHAPGERTCIQTMKLAASRALISARKGLCPKAPQPPAEQSKMARNLIYDHEAAVFSAQDAVIG